MIWWFPLYVYPIYAYTQEGPTSKVYEFFQITAIILALSSVLALIIGHSKYTNLYLNLFAILYAVNAIGGMFLYTKKVIKSFEPVEWVNLLIHGLFFYGMYSA